MKHDILMGEAVSFQESTDACNVKGFAKCTAGVDVEGNVSVGCCSRNS